jgi:hypothetical protein
MKKTLAIAASLVVVATVIIVVVVRRNHGPHHHHDSGKTSSVEAVGIDQTDTSVSMMAMLNAPEQATPCLTAYGAVEAEGAVMKLHNGKSMFKWVAPKDDFVAACQQLPALEQQCMAPRYRRDHAEDCQKARPMPDVLKKMYVGEPIVEPNYEKQ